MTKYTYNTSNYSRSDDDLSALLDVVERDAPRVSEWPELHAFYSINVNTEIVIDQDNLARLVRLGAAIVFRAEED